MQMFEHPTKSVFFLPTLAADNLPSDIFFKLCSTQGMFKIHPQIFSGETNLACLCHFRTEITAFPNFQGHEIEVTMHEHLKKGLF